MRRWWTLGLGAMTCLAATGVWGWSGSAGAAPICSGTTTVTCTFSFTGSSDSFTVPPGVTSVMVVALGAQGGASQDGSSGGLGGQATVTISVTPGETLQVNVGGQPATGNPASGGFNLGGPSGTATPGRAGPAPVSGGGGGGASDVRQGGTGVANRIVIAGGGGGGGGSAGPCAGGGGGGTTGDNGVICFGLEGAGATQSTGGAGGMGGAGGDAFSPGSGAHSGGGGGGGFFGGGGGQGVNGESIIAGSGGGGSGFTTNGAGLASGVQSGNGVVTIVYLAPPTTPVPLVVVPRFTG